LADASLEQAQSIAIGAVSNVANLKTFAAISIRNTTPKTAADITAPFHIAHDKRLAVFWFMFPFYAASSVATCGNFVKLSGSTCVTVITL
jgi:hypothetical protein